LVELANLFERSMINNFNVFGRFAFRKHQRYAYRRKPINIGLFDVFSVQMTKYSCEFVEKNSEEFRVLFFDLIRRREFEDAITLSTNSQRNVRIRFEAVERSFPKDDDDAQSN
jgi:hypothetical protein